MDFSLQEYAPFRAEVDQWVRDRWPSGFAPRFETRGPEYVALSRKIQVELAQKGWLAGAWPVEYGGQGWSKLQQVTFNEAIAYRRVPLNSLGTSTIGPTIMVYGSPEQKERFLRGTASGEIFWSQGFSEPNAGSDLASLQTRAVADGDDFVINGAKIWGNHSFADYCLLLTRTDPEAPKHRGITQFILPLKTTPGITVQPILDSNHHPHWTLMTLEDVRLPRSAVIGEVNRGWYQTATSLDFERSQISWVANSRRTLETLYHLAKTRTRHGQPLIEDPQVRDRLGELTIQLEMARWLAYRVAYLQDNGQVPNYEASMSKVWSTETLQRIMREGMTLVGPLAPLTGGTEWAELEGTLNAEFWDSAGHTFAGGASEIQRNIIATRGLGLPR